MRKVRQIGGLVACEQCPAEISVDALRCPACGAITATARTRRRYIRWEIAAWILLAWLVFAIIASR